MVLAVSSIYLVFRLVAPDRLDGSRGVVCAAADGRRDRGYSYPKVILYAVAATLWWCVRAEPTRQKAILLGAWVAAAFYWRADHGVYIAAGVVLAMVCGTRLKPRQHARLAQAGGVSLAWCSPILIFAASTMGLRPYVPAGAGHRRPAAHDDLNAHVAEWPIRRVRRWIRSGRGREFAPVVGLRWTENSSQGDARRSAVSLRARRRFRATAHRCKSACQIALCTRSWADQRADRRGHNRDRSRSSRHPRGRRGPLWERLRILSMVASVQVVPGRERAGHARRGRRRDFLRAAAHRSLAAVPWLHRYLRAEVDACAI